jgi:hypothetical protein
MDPVTDEKKQREAELETLRARSPQKIRITGIGWCSAFSPNSKPKVAFQWKNFWGFLPPKSLRHPRILRVNLNPTKQ